MIAAITSSVTSVIGWVGEVVSSLVGESGELADLLPLFAIGVAASAFMFAIKAIRGLTWGA